MADILQAIEGRLSFTAGASQRLRDQVARLDRYMETSSLADVFAKAGHGYFHPTVDLMPMPNVRSFDQSASTTGASPVDGVTVASSSPSTSLSALWPPVSSAAPITSDLATMADPSTLAPLNQANQPTFQLPDNILAPFAGDFSSQIFQNTWYGIPPTPRSWFTVDEFAS